MDTYSGVLWIIGLLGAVFMIGILRRHVEIIINFVLRGVLGLFMIYFANYVLSPFMPEVCVGYNPFTFLTSGFLGFSGVLMMYGVQLYMQIGYF